MELKVCRRDAGSASLFRWQPVRIVIGADVHERTLNRSLRLQPPERLNRSRLAGFNPLNLLLGKRWLDLRERLGPEDCQFCFELAHRERLLTHQILVKSRIEAHRQKILTRRAEFRLQAAYFAVQILE